MKKLNTGDQDEHESLYCSRVVNFIGAILLIQLWIFSSLVWWRTHEVDTTMFMRIDYWSDPSEPIIHEWLDYDDISDNFKHAILAGGRKIYSSSWF